MVDQTNQAAVQARAYQLWVESGCADGNHEDHWRRAEAECGAASDASSTAAEGDGALNPSKADGRTPDQPVDADRRLRRVPSPITSS